MSDIWSNAGAEIAPRGEDWLYRHNGEIHGPVPQRAIVEKLISGQLDLKTPVAREGGDFHPINQVKAFEENIGEVKKALRRRTAKKIRNFMLVAAVAVIAIGAAGGIYLKQEAEKKRLAAEAAAEEERQRKESERKRLEAEIAELQKGVELVGLVSVDMSKMTVAGTSSNGRKPRTKRPRTGSRDPQRDAEAPLVSQCQRDNTEIFGVLRKNLAKINVCVQDEKDRDKQGLLPKTLTLAFVAKPDGKVTEFSIENRHYRTGPMRNCMLKVFRQVRFVAKGGAGCPVTIPINIGN